MPTPISFLRSIQSPGVEFKEIDLSAYTPADTGTNSLVMGYTTDGTPYEPLLINSVTDLLANYGQPSNEAERYFHYAAREVLDNNGGVWAAKLPYQNIKDQHYSYIPLTFSPGISAADLQTGYDKYTPLATTLDAVAGVTESPEQPIDSFIVGEMGVPSNISTSRLDNIKMRGEVILSDVSNIPATDADEAIPAGTNFIIVDKSKSSLTGPKERGGKFVVMIDLVDALVSQRTLASDDSEPINIIDGITLPPTARWVSIDGNDQLIADSSENFTKALTASVKDASVSRDLAAYFETVEFTADGSGIKTEYKNYTGMLLCEANVDPNNNGKISISVSEAYFGSLCSDERNPATGQLEYLPLIVNSNSNNIGFYHVVANVGDLAPYQIGTVAAGETFVINDGSDNNAGSLVGFSEAESAKFITSTAILEDIDIVTNKVDDIYSQQVDLVVDAGLSTIAQFINDGLLVPDTIAVAQVDSVEVDAVALDDVTITVNGNDYTSTFDTDNDTTAAALALLVDADADVTASVTGSVITVTALIAGTPFTITSTETITNVTPNQAFVASTGEELPQLFNPEYDVDDNINIDSPAKVGVWKSVQDKLINFCSNVRKDCMEIADVPRNLAIRGNEKVLRNTAPRNTFSNSIAPQLRYISNLNSSYAALYSSWEYKLDQYSGQFFWMPPSASVAGIYTRTDTQFNFWEAPYGLTRGIIRGISDISFQPKQADSDALYSRSINYAKDYPFGGIVLEGQKTTQIKPSAFDRVNVRRTFLRLERATAKVAKYYVGELNNVATRRRLLSQLTPMFEAVKAAGGIRDYKLVCDTTNNTDPVIERNELAFTAYIMPTKAIDFVLLAFVATAQGTSIDEVI